MISLSKTDLERLQKGLDFFFHRKATSINVEVKYLNSDYLREDEPPSLVTLQLTFPGVDRKDVPSTPSIVVCHVCEYGDDGKVLNSEVCKRCQHGSEFSPIDIDPVEVSKRKESSAAKDFLPSCMQQTFVVTCNDIVEAGDFATVQQASIASRALRWKHKRALSSIYSDSEYYKRFHWRIKPVRS